MLAARSISPCGRSRTVDRDWALRDSTVESLALPILAPQRRLTKTQEEETAAAQTVPWENPYISPGDLRIHRCRETRVLVLESAGSC
ncbi:hypothetical protein DTO195F2_6185 [Paecilomyces variotii]|nr:hypothetical protein DTO195F2_6185 [Paecilomyces variotii]KAJ9369067.1 hypothetical protein DTO282E5_6276 [Paecilomyces variotii]